MSPKEWKRVPLHSVAEVRTGLAKGKQGLIDSVELPYLRVANVQDGYFDLTEVKAIRVERNAIERYSLRAGDVLMTEGGDFDKLGRGAVWNAVISPCLHQNHVFAVRPKDGVLYSAFLAALSSSQYGRTYFQGCAKRSTNLASINSSQLKEFPVILPPHPEQEEIVRILSTWDGAIATTEKVLASSRRQKDALTHDLLLGRVRRFGHAASSRRVRTRVGLLPQDWRHLPLGDIAVELGNKNVANRALPVLSCTKHHGLVDSLSYFNKRVFSENTSTYKIVPRGAFAYATNHIDEGSIGYQNLYDEALISPMYTVFQVGEQINHGFLYKLLKTEHYRQLFAASTNASVDRRGSLRWSEFKKIEVPVPSLEEQVAINEVLDGADQEIVQLISQLDALKAERRVLMTDLLTGKRRVNLAKVATAQEPA
ncbi:restriction endonuclease subunit S [Achromobacter insolitus]|uniref:restriction endonuclease subunit S n=1 Tax=Achromobacter insolitus TaxID=217204 RepID=UPI0011EAB0EB|nr:restriction endonuclease subunit S [Achromobacter insolitus]QEK90314.1 restriction endonuclease subunit S [Achromobacter insolitus]